METLHQLLASELRHSVQLLVADCISQLLVQFTISTLNGHVLLDCFILGDVSRIVYSLVSPFSRLLCWFVGLVCQFIFKLISLTEIFVTQQLRQLTEYGAILMAIV